MVIGDKTHGTNNQLKMTISFVISILCLILLGIFVFILLFVLIKRKSCNQENENDEEKIYQSEETVQAPKRKRKLSKTLKSTHFVEHQSVREANSLIDTTLTWIETLVMRVFSSIVYLCSYLKKVWIESPSPF